MITIGSLLVVSAALSATGVLDWVGQKLLGRVDQEAVAMRRLAVALVATSAFLLNTALVAMMVPVVVDWCRRRGISPSRLLIPVSYLTILGGVCSLIGTSTTLIVNGILKQEYEKHTAVARLDTSPPDSAYRAAEIHRGHPADAPVRNRPRRLAVCPVRHGRPADFSGRRLLPNRSEMIEQLEENRREYVVEMLVQPECRLIGQTVEAAGLRELPGLYLIEIDRDGDIVTPVGPDDVDSPGRSTRLCRRGQHDC